VSQQTEVPTATLLRDEAVGDALEHLRNAGPWEDTIMALRKLYGTGVKDAFDTCVKVINAYPSSG
jgi:hypothetical protein